MMRQIHFHSGDGRFCGSKEQGRQFTMEENDVTCTRCANKDQFFLSESGRALVEEFEIAQQ